MNCLKNVLLQDTLKYFCIEVHANNIMLDVTTLIVEPVYGSCNELMFMLKKNLIVKNGLG